MVSGITTAPVSSDSATDTTIPVPFGTTIDTTIPVPSGTTTDTTGTFIETKVVVATTSIVVKDSNSTTTERESRTFSTLTQGTDPFYHTICMYNINGITDAAGLQNLYFIGMYFNNGKH